METAQESVESQSPSAAPLKTRKKRGRKPKVNQSVTGAYPQPVDPKVFEVRKEKDINNPHSSRPAGQPHERKVLLKGIDKSYAHLVEQHKLAESEGLPFNIPKVMVFNKRARVLLPNVRDWGTGEITIPIEVDRSDESPVAVFKLEY